MLSLKPTFHAHDYNIIRAPRCTPQLSSGMLMTRLLRLFPKEPLDTLRAWPCNSFSLHHFFRLKICKKHNCQETVPSKPFVLSMNIQKKECQECPLGFSQTFISTTNFRLSFCGSTNSQPLDSSSWSLVVH